MDALARPRPSPLKPGRVGSDDSPAAVLPPTSSVTIRHISAQLSCTSTDMQRVIVIGSMQLQLNPSESKERDAGSESDSAGLYAHELRVISAA